MFDMPTVLFSMFVVKGTMALILLSFWVTRFRADGLPEMTVATAFGAIWAFAGIAVVDRSNYVLAVVPLTLICASDMLAARAMRRLQGLAIRQWVEMLLLLLFFLAISYFCAKAHSIPDSLGVASVASTVFAGLAARDLLTERRPGLRTGCRILGVAFGLWALFHLVLIFVRPLYGSGPAIADQIVAVDYAVAFMNMIVAITWGLGFLWTSYSNAQFRFRAAFDELNRFSGAVAHDLKAPLNAVIGNLEAYRHLSDAGAPQRNQGFLDSAHEGALRMNQFIDDLLDHARTAQFNPDLETVEPNACIAYVTSLLDHQIVSAGAMVVVEPLPPVQANALPFSRVILNLLDNALKYRAPERPLQVRITGRRIGGTVEIEVADNGSGIAPEDRARIFTRFVRPETTTAQGAGIGLSECRLILERYHGAITVDSEPGAGATFTIRLPAAVS